MSCKFYKTMNEYFKEFYILITVSSALALIIGFFYFLYIVAFENYVKSSSDVSFALIYLVFCLISIGVGVGIIDKDDWKETMKDKKSEEN
ncbi:hypothetical protein [Halarcobacter sp.]|uniref:hypothetical protein n=1 Tax=Halarcobacter sp. TaxID=2321133 RepID=UPI002AA8A8DF|nr:hypothetical protein [Halarcobacter sp.]